ncbi:hypothetical protein FRB94_003437 [Tulasnella sp. JGI-2019a]|nr:hypothetical protein FRB93_005301 [Tulasnella sp. JGI-2019a]KAG9002966.1 hypothetical protein FRB94_003437 [Tulasnella sp. JGI-2019a]
MSTIDQDETSIAADTSSLERRQIQIQEAVSLNSLGVKYLEKFRVQRAPQLLDAAIASFQAACQLQPLDDPARSETLYNLATTLDDRYRIYENRSDLEAAIIYHQEALDLRPVGHPSRPLSLNNYASLLLNSYQHFGNREHLDTAIELHRENLSLFPAGHPSRWMALNNLSLALKNRFQATGGRDDLEEAISHHLEALELLPPGHPSRHLLLNNAGTALQLRYEHFDRDEDLEASIRYHTDALNLRPVGNPYRPRSLTNLGIVLQLRYQRFRDNTDITTAISHLHDALATSSEGPSTHATILSELANGLDLRFQQMREQDDLDTAILYQSEVLKLRPNGHPERPKTLINLAAELLRRYEVKKSQADLDGAITYITEARDISPIGYPFHLSNLQLLASAYILRFELLRNRSDVDQAVVMYQSTLDNPLGQSKLVFGLQNLAAALRARYATYSDEADIQAAISHLKLSYNITTVDSPFRTTCATNLATALLQRIMPKDNRFDKDQELQDRMFVESIPQDSPDVVTAVLLLREAANSEKSPIHSRLRAALMWVRVAEPLKHISLSMAYLVALHHFWAYVTSSQNILTQNARLSDRDTDFEGAVSVASAAAANALHSFQVQVAVQYLEQGRLIITNQLHKFRAPLDDLRATDRDLADEFSQLSLQMQSDGSTYLGPEILEAEDKIARRAAISQKWFETVDRIRQLPGFSDFLLPAPWDRLRTAAAGGPVIIINISHIGSHAIIIPQDPTAQGIAISLPLATPRVVWNLADQLRGIINQQPPDITVKIAGVLRQLWHIIVEDVTRKLQDNLKVPKRSRVWWCLTSRAWFLPFHAAGPYMPGQRGFADRYVSSYTPTLMTLIRSREGHKQQAPVTSAPRILVVGMPQTPGEGDLPSVSEEITQIQNIAENATVLKGPTATREGVLSYLNDHRWAHFACHGFQDQGNAFKSHFALADGKLTLLDIIRSGLPNGELAFLSACHSAAGDAQIPDEAVHLAAGLQFAGFAGVVGTLWAMADIDGPVVAEEFYKYMFRNGEQVDHRDAAAALSAATTALRRQKVPLERWINFVHYGA